jgi:hypothetical protein
MNFIGKSLLEISYNSKRNTSQENEVMGRKNAVICTAIN